MPPSSVCETSDAVITTIRGARRALGPDASVRGSLQVVGDKVRVLQPETSAPIGSPGEIDLSGFLLLPGFINAHDHLQYALHPRIGNPPYSNYVEWGDDIHATSSSVIDRYNSVPRSVRLLWGGIRNLLCGVTTVCHHDPFWSVLQDKSYPIKVLRDYGWAHSVRLADDIHHSWSTTRDSYPFFVHTCEGTDEVSRGELAELDGLGMLNANTVVVHGLALDADGIALLRKRKASLILCLSSNQFLYGQLPDWENLGPVNDIALGNDSSLTAAGDLLDEVRFAIERGSIPMGRVYRMITDLPASIARLDNGEGCIRDLGCADIVAIRDNGDPPEKRLPTLSWRDIEFVMIAGELRLASEDVWDLLPMPARHGMEPIAVDGVVRWLRAPVRKLLQQAEVVLGLGGVQLGGRVVQSVDTEILEPRSVAGEAAFQPEEMV